LLSPKVWRFATRAVPVLKVLCAKQKSDHAVWQQF